MSNDLFLFSRIEGECYSQRFKLSRDTAWRIVAIKTTLYLSVRAGMAIKCRAVPHTVSQIKLHGANDECHKEIVMEVDYSGHSPTQTGEISLLRTGCVCGVSSCCVH